VARILSRAETVVSPWVRLVEKTVEFGHGEPPQTYHCFAQADYVVAIARTPSGRIPIIRQFRPAVNCETWEFPAGLLEVGETPESCCRRELQEEAGLTVTTAHSLGAFFPDTGRLENRIHVFVADSSEPDPAFVPEAWLSVAFVSPSELRDRILGGSFIHQLHLGALALAYLKGLGSGIL
jgi:ADP-ribose pyrophosphatase